MELSIEDHARFAEAVKAAAKGERVIVTENGEPVAEVVAAKSRGRLNWDALQRAREAYGLSEAKIEIPDDFDDPAFSRRVLGLDP